MSKATVQFSVRFPPCGAELHPSFSSAVRDGNVFVLSYPIHNNYYLKGRKYQKLWAEEKAKHLRSWGITATICEGIPSEK